MKQASISRLLAAAAVAAFAMANVHAAGQDAKPAAAATASAEDTALAAKVQAALGEIKGVSVSAVQGEVVLSGEVASAADAERAAQLAASVEGVRQVKNSLVVAAVK